MCNNLYYIAGIDNGQELQDELDGSSHYSSRLRNSYTSDRTPQPVKTNPNKPAKKPRGWPKGKKRNVPTETPKVNNTNI